MPGRRRWRTLGLLLVVIAVAGPPSGAQPGDGSDPPPQAPQSQPDRKGTADQLTELERLVKPLVASGYAKSLVLAVVDGDDTLVWGHGAVGNAGRPAHSPDGRTIYEIGSITKVFTSILLAELVRRGKARLDAPISQYLPDGVTAPTTDGKPITLEQLATHTSGLPRMPDNLTMSADPFADYDVAALHGFLTAHKLAHVPGEHHEYSNLGAGLLGYLLGRIAGTSYEQALHDYVIGPLGLRDTGFRLTDEQMSRFTDGHALAGGPVPHWNWDVLAGCGGLRSTANDLLAFLRTNMGHTATPLRAAIEFSHRERCPHTSPEIKMALGWHLLPVGGSTIVWHNGGTGGFYSFIGFDRATDRGVVALCNSAFWQLPLLDTQLMRFVLGKEVRPLELRPTVDVPSETLADYEGQYLVALAGVTLTVTMRNGQLQLIQPNAPNPMPLLPASETAFFVPGAPQVTFRFETNPDGNVTAMVIEEPGRATRAPRVGGADDEPDDE